MGKAPANPALKTVALTFLDGAAGRAVGQESRAQPIATHDRGHSAALAAVQSAGSTQASPEAGSPPQRGRHALQGNIDRTTWPVIQGWVWDPESPGKRIQLELVEGGTTLATAIASNRRPDIVERGIGDGQYGFSINLGDGLLSKDRHVLHLRCAESGAVLPGSPIIIEPRAPAIDRQSATRDKIEFQGHIDCIDTEWRLCGWAYDPSGGEPLKVELVENETVIASAQATEFRQDILDAGLGEGKCAFYIQIPSDLFDGGFHNLTIYGVSGGQREPMGKPFGTVFPRLGRRHGASQTFVPAIKIFELVTETKSPNGSRPSNELVNELADVLRKIGLRFGHSAALGLLYAYALRRSIDKDGLVTRLKRIHSNPSEYEGIVAEVIFSQEAAVIHGSSNYLTLDPIGYLRTWLDKRFGLLELPE